MVIAFENQENTTFSCPFGVLYAYRRMSFGLLTRLQLFRDTWSIYFQNILKEKWRPLWLTSQPLELLWSYFWCMFGEIIQSTSEMYWKRLSTKPGEVLPLYSEPWIVLGHVIFKRGIDVNQAKIKLIMKLPNLSTIKEVLVPW